MDIKRTTVTTDTYFTRLSSEARIESAVPAPDGRPVGKILGCNAKVRVTSSTASERGVDVVGTITVSVLALDRQDVPFGFDAEADFSHRVPCPVSVSGLEPIVTAQITECAMRSDDGGLRLCGSVLINVAVLKHDELSCVCDLSGERGLELEFASVSSARRALKAVKSIKLREELELDEAVTLVSGSGRIKEIKLSPTGTGYDAVGKVELRCLVLFGDGALSERSFELSFESEIEGDPVSNPIVDAELTRLDVRMYSGGSGLVEAEALICITVYSVQSETATILSDGYDAEGTFSCQKESGSYLDYLGRESIRQEIRYPLEVPSYLPELSAPVSLCCNPAVTHAACENGVATVEGLIMATVVYRGDNGSLSSFTEDVPFSVSIDCADCAYILPRIEVCCHRLSGSGRALEFRSELSLCADIYALRSFTYTKSLERGSEVDTHEGILIYFTDAGETLFSIGKRFGMSKRGILELNPDLTEPLSSGKQVILFR